MEQSLLLFIVLTLVLGLQIYMNLKRRSKERFL